MEGLVKYNLMEEMHRSLEHHHFAVEDVDTGIPDLRHFIYKYVFSPRSSVIMSSSAFNVECMRW
jgi:hypothetical protein